MSIQDFYNASHISSNFGDARPGGRKHRGVDFAHSNGTAIPSLTNGIVIGELNPASWHGFGYQITIKADNGVVWSYAHMNAASTLGVGNRVNAGNIVGYVGTTGATTGPCVHVEYNAGSYSDPAPHIADIVNVPSSNQDVVNRQNYLNATFNPGLTVDGINGPATKQAIVNYQNVLGITADGIWGPNTQAAHQAYYDARHTAPVTVTGNIADVQQALKSKYPLYAGKLTVDNINGPMTIAAVKEFQRRAGLVADGIAGVLTRNALGI